MATDYPVADAMLALSRTSRIAVHEEFAAAAARLHARQGKPPPSTDQVEAMMRRPTLDAFEFTKVTRECVVSENQVYLHSYWQPAVEAALSRGGTVTLHMGYFCFHRYFRDMTRIAADSLSAAWPGSGNPTAHILAFLDNAVVTDLHGRGGGTQPQTRASVTSAELFDVLEGRSSAAILEGDAQHRSSNQWSRRARPGLEVLSADGKRSIDTHQFRRLYQQASEASRTPRNLRHLRDNGRFTPDARSVVEELQKSVHGTSDSLPEVVKRVFDLHLSDWGDTNV